MVKWHPEWKARPRNRTTCNWHLKYRNTLNVSVFYVIVVALVLRFDEVGKQLRQERHEERDARVNLHAAPTELGLFPESMAINMPLLTELSRAV